ncbi:MAG: TPR domain-containing protein, partial [Myxococcaceae bacterium]
LQEEPAMVFAPPQLAPVEPLRSPPPPTMSLNPVPVEPSPPPPIAFNPSPPPAIEPLRSPPGPTAPANVILFPPKGPREGTALPAPFAAYEPPPAVETESSFLVAPPPSRRESELAKRGLLLDWGHSEGEGLDSPSTWAPAVPAWAPGSLGQPPAESAEARSPAPLPEPVAPAPLSKPPVFGGAASEATPSPPPPARKPDPLTAARKDDGQPVRTGDPLVARAGDAAPFASLTDPPARKDDSLPTLVLEPFDEDPSAPAPQVVLPPQLDEPKKPSVHHTLPEEGKFFNGATEEDLTAEMSLIQKRSGAGRWIAVAAVLLAVSGAAAYYFLPGEEPPAPVAVPEKAAEPKTEVVKTEPPLEPPKSALPEPELLPRKPEVAKPEAPKPEPQKVEALKPEPAPELAKVEPAKTEPAKAEPARTDPEPAKTPAPDVKTAAVTPEPEPAKREPSGTPVDVDGEFNKSLRAGKAAFQNQRFKSAVVAYRKAYALKPNSDEAKLGLGIALVNSDPPSSGYREAVKLLQDVVKTDTTNGRAWFALGMALQFNGQNKAAIVAYKRYLSVEPSGEFSGDARLVLREMGAQ